MKLVVEYKPCVIREHCQGVKRNQLIAYFKVQNKGSFFLHSSRYCRGLYRCWGGGSVCSEAFGGKKPSAKDYDGQCIWPIPTRFEHPERDQEYFGSFHRREFWSAWSQSSRNYVRGEGSITRLAFLWSDGPGKTSSIRKKCSISSQ